MPWPTPLVQLMAASEDQVDTNIWRPMRAMIERGPLAEVIRSDRSSCASATTA